MDKDPSRVAEYRGKPVRAIQVTVDNVPHVISWLQERGIAATDNGGTVTMGLTDLAPEGWWIVVKQSGNPRVLDAAAFADEYEPAP